MSLIYFLNLLGKALGLTQTQVAEQLGISQQTLSL
ncbi:helix-turn-helix transcriptional regulator [Vibrio neptunius]|nr:helix-turn-helix transcriptional regulator [Vibrio neptunius]